GGSVQQQSWRRFAATTLVAVLPLLVAACAGGSGAQPAPPARSTAAEPAPSSPPAASQPATAQDRAPDRWDEILAAGQREGVVVLAGPAAAAVREGLKAFTDQYRIQVDYLAGQEGQHYARIEPEFSAGK